MSAAGWETAVHVDRSELSTHTNELNALVVKLYERISTLHNSEKVRHRIEGNDGLNALEDTLFRCAFAVRTVKNCALPVNRLPPEILIHIFGLVQEPLLRLRHGTRYGPTHTFVRIADICPITMVCQHWREVAVNTPSLWSTVTDSKFIHYLHRCTSGPVNVCLGNNTTVTMLDKLTNYAPRIRVLKADCHELQEDLINMLLAFPLTGLEHCTLAYATIFRNQHNSGAMRCLFASHDSLRSLCLEAIPFLPSNNFPRLAHLEIADPNWAGDPNTFLYQVLTLLSRSPALRTLHVDLPSRAGTADSKWGAQKVELAVLDTLSVTEGQNAGWPGVAGRHGAFRRELLSHIDAPRTRVASLGGYHVNALLPSLASAGVLQGKKALHLQIEVTSLYATATMTVIALNRAQSETTRLEVQEDWTSTAKDRMEEEMARCLCDMITSHHLFSTLTHLWIEHRSSKWVLLRQKVPLISALPHLKSLALVNRLTDEVRVDSILVDLEIPSNGHVSCPQLCCLLVDCMAEEEVDYVRQLARSRAAAGSPIDRKLVIGLLTPNRHIFAVRVGLPYDYACYEYNALGERTLRQDQRRFPYSPQTLVYIIFKCIADPR